MGKFATGGSIPRYMDGSEVLTSPFFNKKKFKNLTSEIEKSGINKVFNLDMNKGWHDMSSAEQKTLRAIQKWKSIDYYSIKKELMNPVQRPARKIDTYPFPFIKALDDAFSTTELNYDGKFPFYHGPSIASSALYNKQIGDTYRNPSYTAMTFNPQTAGYHMTSSQFGMDPRLEMPNLSMIKYHPNGKENATYLPGLESEVLFPRNMQMEIIDINDVMFPYIDGSTRKPILKPVRLFTVDNLMHSLKRRHSYARGGSIYGPADIPMLSGLLAPKQQAHIARTIDIAHGIFEQMGKTKLNSHILDQAIQLHDIAKEVDPDKHGNFASRFIKQSKILKGSPYEQLVSFLVDKHQGVNMPKISGFGKGDQKQLKGLIPLMRIADTLSRGTFDQLPISFSKSGKMKLVDVDLGLSKKKMARLQTSISAYNKYSKGYATGGSTLNNPIRVSDGELAIPRGMVDKIGLSTLRRINAGDMSYASAFVAGGMAPFEFDGPGTGTSDSILTDADRGPKGQDASDIGFIIRRTSSDRLKSIIGRAMGGIIPGYAEGDQPMDNYGNVIPASLLQKPSIDFIRERFKQYEGVKYIGKKTVFPAVTKALESIKEFTNINDLLDVVMQAVDSTNVIHESSKSVGGKISPYERALRNSRSALSEAFSDIYNQFDPAAVTDLQESEARNKKSLDDQTDAINDVTEAERRREKAINDAIKSITDQQGGMYRGNVRYVRHGEFGENDLRYIGGDAPSRTELTSEQDRLGAPRKEPGSISSWYIRNIKGLGQNIGREMFNPTEQQIGFQTQIKMPIFMENTPNQQVQDHLDKSFKEFINFDSIVKQVLHEEFGKYIGGRNIDDIVKVSSTTEDGMVEIPLGTHGELYEKSQKTYDGISVGAAK